MNFHPVDIMQLSDLSFEPFVSSYNPDDEEKILLIKYKGSYGYGSGGSKDVEYILATAALCQTAWHCKWLVLDFSHLNYQSGDGMDNIFSLTYDSSLRVNSPMVVIVGAGCRHALQSLLEEEYKDLCADSLESAIELLQKQEIVYEQAMSLHSQTFVKEQRKFRGLYIRDAYIRHAKFTRKR